MSVPEYVEHPDRWLAARAARIKANRAKTNRRKLDAALASDSLEFKQWLGLASFVADESLHEACRVAYDEVETTSAAWTIALEQWRASGRKETTPDEHAVWLAWSTATRRYDAANDALSVASHHAATAFHKRYGYRPDWVRDAIDNWGGLTEKQLEAARRTFAKIAARVEGRDAEENARRANAPHWVAGRQTFTGVVKSVRVRSMVVGYNVSVETVKGLIVLEDGRKTWTSLPKSAAPDTSADSTNEWATRYDALKGQTLTITATMELSEDDPTMAFGQRARLGAPAAKKACRRAQQLDSATIADESTELSDDATIDRETAKREAKRERARRRREAKRAGSAQ